MNSENISERAVVQGTTRHMNPEVNSTTHHADIQRAQKKPSRFSKPARFKKSPNK
ncbi:MAG: hypothetical protein GQ527_03785 [Bacteroidales bacterium]|nr:hypothetical protein [Bacteroidales bacterium]